MNNTDIPRASAWMQRMFDSAADRYVLSNKVLTFCQDEKWRQAAVDAIKPQNNLKILDICTGTADLALKIAKKFPDSMIYALDYSPSMLAAARKRADREAWQNIIFKESDCANMEFENDCFDYVTISFGFRNLSHSRDNLANALKEVYRVLKKDSRFVILETSQPKSEFIRNVYHFYAGRLVPKIGRIFSGRREPYSYLGGSIVKFFNRDEIISIVESAGFKIEKIRPFMFGAILLCVFQK